MDARDRTTLELMVQYAEEAIAWSQENPRWTESRKDSAAIAHNVSEIGELAQGRLSNATKAEYHDIPWKLIEKMRNVIRHDYSKPQFDIKILEATVRNDLKPLVQRIRTILG